jgi:hypothetical protein
MEKYTRYPVTYFGVRYKEHDGWRVYAWLKTYEEVVNELQSDQNIIDIRKITQGTGGKRSDEEYPTINIREAESSAFGWGWAYDQSSNLFRAPGELLNPPSSSPLIANECRIKITKPRNDWADLCFALNEEGCVCVVVMYLINFQD